MATRVWAEVKMVILTFVSRLDNNVTYPLVRVSASSISKREARTVFILFSKRKKMNNSNKRRKKVKTPPAYAEAMMINKEINKEPQVQQRLLNRPAISNKLGVKVEYPATNLGRDSRQAKQKAKIDVNANNFLPKLAGPNSGNIKMNPKVPSSPEPMDYRTSYLDKYQNKPGFHLPDLTTGKAARIQPREEIIRRVDELERQAMATQRNTRMYSDNTRMPTSYEYADNTRMPTSYEYSDNTRMPTSYEYADNTRMPTSYEYADNTRMPTSYEHDKKAVYMHVARKADEQAIPEYHPEIEGARFVPNPPNTPKTRRPLRNRHNSKKEEAKKGLPSLQDVSAKKKSYY